MPSPLHEQEVNRLYQLLNEEQLHFLQHFLKQSKKSKWLESLARKKGVVLTPDASLDSIWEQLDDWELREVLDGGYGNRPFQCECGHALRFCYIVHHRQEAKTYRLGETCLGHYTAMSPELIRDITSGFHKIDIERDDILTRLEKGWQLPDHYDDLPLPPAIRNQIAIGLPLSSAQAGRIEKMFQHQILRRRRQKLLERQARRRHPPSGSSPQWSAAPTIAYDELLLKHGEHLNLIMEHEELLAGEAMIALWSRMQLHLQQLKGGQAFDYPQFLQNMFRLLYALKLY